MCANILSVIDAAAFPKAKHFLKTRGAKDFKGQITEAALEFGVTLMISLCRVLLK